MRWNSLFILLLWVVWGCQEQKEAVSEKIIFSQAMCAPVTTDKEWYTSDNIAPLFDGLVNLNFTISTNNELVQKYFNQGLVLAYGFNHAEAARSFHYASKLDPECAMTFWGFAYVLGPNYNAGMESDNYERAYEAIQKAIELSEENTTPIERDLILALSKRYVKSPVDDRYPLDVAYSKAMADLYKKYEANGEIGTLYAESLMNLHPWDLFDQETGEIREWTPEILSTLEQVIKEHPTHCGANHFYIHAVESSTTPERGMKSAKLFVDGLVPNAGHLVHMPSHIYIRTGDYHQGTLANIEAIDVDSAYITACHAQGAYPLAYFPHNQHFMAATATLEGNSKWALYAADAVSKSANLQLMKEPGWGTIQHYYSIPFYVCVKFGKWDEILAMENKVPELDYPQAMYHYAKGMAYLGKGNIGNAKAELQSLSGLAQNEELKEVTIWDINSVYDLVQIAEKVLQAEILANEDETPRSIKLLKEAIEIEDNLNYNEPPDWFFSVRHNLGAILLKAGRFDEAVVVYKEDLKRLPKNGWALNGLVSAYTGLNNKAEMNLAEEKFNTAWATADVDLNGSLVK